MKIVASYSFNQGERVVHKKYPQLMEEIREVVEAVDSESHKTKRSKEQIRNYGMLYSPTGLNRAFKQEFGRRGWSSRREVCEYSKEYYVQGYQAVELNSPQPYREMDFVRRSWVSKCSSGSMPSWYTTSAPR